jgi:hypothetical protein
LLNKHRARYLLAGGVAANLHGSVRATKGIDILVPRVPYLGRDDLIACKRTGRAADRADIEQLEALPAPAPTRRARRRPRP